MFEVLDTRLVKMGSLWLYVIEYKPESIPIYYYVPPHAPHSTALSHATD